MEISLPDNSVNNKLHIALCDDEQEEREHLLSLIHSSGIPATVWEFEEGETFLKDYTCGFFDLILMDIYMKGISGVEVMGIIRKTEPFLPVAFTTISQDYALEAYRMNVDRYIEKPISQEAVTQVLLMAAEKKKSLPGITILSQGNPLVIPIRSLLYVEQMAHYLHFHLLGGQVIKVKGKLDQLLPQMKTFPLFRCHKSFLVNLSYVTGIDRELMIFHMKEGNNVYIRRETFPMAKQAWETWLFTTSRRQRSNHA